MFEVNGCTFNVMIDTGATISCLPERGEVLSRTKVKLENANLLAKLADGSTTHLGKRVRANIRPLGSSLAAKEATFYIQPGEKDIFGYHALIGLRHMKLFDIDILFKSGKTLVMHQNKVIGAESPINRNSYSTIKVIDNISSCSGDCEIQRIVNKYKCVFSDLDDKPIRGRAMRFETFHERPVAAKTRNYTPEEGILMKQHIRGLLDKRIIERTESGYSAQSRIIPKANGAPRLVINYIPLNLVTRRNSYPLPNIVDIINILQGKQFLTTMDCTSGFYQINVDWRDRHKTAFSTSCGSYQFRRCPFGAKNSGAIFQSNMDRIFMDGLMTRCVVYVDDILVFGRSREEHDENLEWILNKCCEFNVKLKLEKCEFAKREVKYLGYLVTGEQIKPIPSKVDKISELKPPTNKKELQSLLGKLNFYSRFIKNYSKHLEPIRSLLSKDRDFQWTSKQQESMNKIVNHLKASDPQVIVPIEQQKAVHLHILDDSIEVLLLTNEMQIVRRASRLLTTAEANYTAVEKQMLGVVLALRKFRTLVRSGCFKIMTPDNQLAKAYKLTHRPERIDNLILKLPPEFDELEFEIDTKLPAPFANKLHNHLAQEIFYVDGACRGNGKPECRASWAVCCEFETDFEAMGFVEDEPSNNTAELMAAIRACEIAKRKGYSQITIVTDSTYCHAAATKYIDDWKSDGWKNYRNKPLANEKLFKRLLEAKEGLQIEWIHVKGHSTSIGNCRADTLARSLLSKKTAILCAVGRTTGELQGNSDEIEEIRSNLGKETHSNFISKKGIIYYSDDKLPESNRLRIYVPSESRKLLLQLAHDDNISGGHLGIRKTSLKLIRFWWPQMRKEVEDYVRTCDLCQHFKNPKGLPPGFLNSIPVSRIFENLHIDMMGPLKSTIGRANRYIITATDAFSKWAFAFPCQHISTTIIIRFVEERIISVHGSPVNIITDRGSQFTSDEWRQFVNKYKIHHKLTTSYHPQSNGTDERFNGTITRIFKNYVDEFHEKWDSQLMWALHVYNTTVHESTGYSPYQVLFGRDCRSPLRPVESIITSDSTDKLLHSTIHDEVRSRVKLAQESQKKFYDKHRSQVKLYKGQLVKVRIHTAPSYLTKKLHYKWDGPMCIIDFVGDKDNPRAVKILDYDSPRLETKIVSIQDVSPYYLRQDKFIDKYQNKADGDIEPHAVDTRVASDTLLYDIWPDDEQPKSRPEETQSPDCETELIDFEEQQAGPTTSSKESSTELIIFGDQQTIDTNKIVEDSPADSQSTQDPQETLNITHRTFSGPTSSSPKRVTISNNIERLIYDPEPEETLVHPIESPPTSDTTQSAQLADGTIDPEATITDKIPQVSVQNVEANEENTDQEQLSQMYDGSRNEQQDPIAWKSLHLSQVTLPDPDTSADSTYNPSANIIRATGASQPIPSNIPNILPTRPVTRSQLKEQQLDPSLLSRIPTARKTTTEAKKKRLKRTYQTLALLVGLEDRDESLLDDLRLIDLGKRTHSKRWWLANSACPP